jgi:hypothetical protein
MYKADRVNSFHGCLLLLTSHFISLDIISLFDASVFSGSYILFNCQSCLSAIEVEFNTHVTSIDLPTAACSGLTLIMHLRYLNFSALFASLPNQFDAFELYTEESVN